MSCAVKGCTNCRKFPKENVSFHTFPRNEESQKEWIGILSIDKERWTWSKNKVVCSEHFKADDFFAVPGRRTLRPNSVPSQKLVRVPSSTILCESTSSSSLHTDLLTSKSVPAELAGSFVTDDVGVRIQDTIRKLDVSGPSQKNSDNSIKKRRVMGAKPIHSYNTSLSTIIKKHMLIKMRMEVYRKKLYSANKTVKYLEEEVSDLKTVIQYLMNHNSNKLTTSDHQ